MLFHNILMDLMHRIMLMLLFVLFYEKHVYSYELVNCCYYYIENV